MSSFELIKLSENTYIRQSDVIKISYDKDNKSINLFYMGYGNGHDGMLKKTLNRNVYNDSDEIYGHLSKLFGMATKNIICEDNIYNEC